MRRYEKMIKDPDIVSAMLDTFDVAYVGFHDSEYPYVVPLNFGYEIKDSKLYIYVHFALTGYKLELMEKDPRVCVTMASFYENHAKPYKSFLHNYRSVMAFGKMSLVPKSDMPKFRNAMNHLLSHYGRDTTSIQPGRMMIMNMYQIECDWDMVYGKSEQPVRTVEDVPYLDVFNMPEDNTPYYVADLLSRKIDNRWPKKANDLQANTAPELGPNSVKVSLHYENQELDLDLMAFMLNEKEIIWERWDIVFYNHLNHDSGAILHTGDDKTFGHDEDLYINFDRFHEKYTRVPVLISVFDAENRQQTLQDANGIEVIITACDGKVLYRMTPGRNTGSAKGMILGEFVKKEGRWVFVPMEEPTEEYWVAELSERYGIRRDWRFILNKPSKNTSA